MDNARNRRTRNVLAAWTGAATTCLLLGAAVAPAAATVAGAAGPSQWTTSGSVTWRTPGLARIGATDLTQRSEVVQQTALAAGDFRTEVQARPLEGQRADMQMVYRYTDPANLSYAAVSQDVGASGFYEVRGGVTKRVGALPATVQPGLTYEFELRATSGVVKAYLSPAGRAPVFVAKHTPASGGPQTRVGVATQSVLDVDTLAVNGSTAGSAPTPTPAPAPAPAPTPAPDPAPSGTVPGMLREIRVSTSAQLTSALAAARPGDVITLADGVYTSKGLLAPVAIGAKTYVGTFVGTGHGTAEHPIVLRGSSRAVIDGKPGEIGTGTQYGLYLVDAQYWSVQGITVQNVSKGVVLDRSNRNELRGLTVQATGQEGIHLRASSSDNAVRDNVVRRTGLKTATYGEGIYLGSANSNWGTYSGGQPDASDRNLVSGNAISQTGAESIDVKEGTTGGVISGNTFDGAGMTGSWADSWIDMKGNGYQVVGNVGRNAKQDGFQVHGALTGWGNNNVFRSNVAEVNAAGYGFWLQNNVKGNVIECGNVVRGAASGHTNTGCR